MNNEPRNLKRLLQPAGLLLLILSFAASAAFGQIEAVVTADNAYRIWLGTEAGVVTFVGGDDNCTAGQIFNQPETYTIPKADLTGAQYIYVVAYGDEAVTEGFLGQFTSAATTINTGANPWEVFATGIDFDPDCPSGATPGPPETSDINAQITLANTSAGPATSSVSWVGPSVGEANDSAGGSFPIVGEINADARWIWFDDNGVSKDYLIFRLPLLDVLQCVLPPADMVAWWPFDESSGTMAEDLAGNHKGNHKGDPTPTAGYVSQALSFDGNDYVRVSDANDLDFGGFGDFSFDAWVKPEDASGVLTILDKRTRDEFGMGYVRGYHLFLFNGQLGLQYSDASATGYTNYLSTGTVDIGQWSHVAATVKRNGNPGVRLYINGEVSGEFTSTGLSNLDNSADLTIGRRSNDFGGGFFPGEIDEVEIFSRELSAAEVQSLFDAGSLGKCKEKSTVCYLNYARFAISVDWTDFQDVSGVGTAVPLTNDTCYFYFFDKANVEMTLKVLDGRGFNQHWWVFYGALSNVEYTVTVTDTETGAVKTYFNPLSNFASSGDIQAFPEILEP